MNQELLNKYDRKFTQNFYWNLFDAITSQGLLLAHHIITRNLLGIEFHGIFSCILSSFYFALIVLNIGLDYSLAPFVKQIIDNKTNFRSFIKWQLIPQFIFILICALILYLGFFNLNILNLNFNYKLSILVALTFISESLRKTLKTFLQLAFLSKITAILEVLGMAIYITAVWLLYYFNYLNNYNSALNYSWLILFVVSIIQAIILLFYFYKLYNQADLNKNTSNNIEKLDNNKIWHTRFFVWLSSLTVQFFGSNFLVPLCGLYFGLEQASFLKIVSTIARWITTIIQKGFGISSSALLAHTKNLSSKEKAETFKYLSYTFNQIIYAALIFLIINGQKIVLSETITINIISWTTLYMILVLSFSENFFILYERWLIVEEKTQYLFLFNILNIIPIYYLVKYSNFTILSLIISILAIRVFMFIALTIFSFYKWRISPELAPNLKMVLFSTIFSVILYFLI